MQPTDDPPTVYLANLSAREQYENAVAFCAHLLPRREAVWWGCGSTRACLGDLKRATTSGLLAAESWVHEPTDGNRLRALQLGTSGDNSDPSTWLALAAGWSGGMLTSHPSPPLPVPIYMTARAVRIAILLSARHLAPTQRATRLRACVSDGTALAEPVKAAWNGAENGMSPTAPADSLRRELPSTRTSI